MRVGEFNGLLFSGGATFIIKGCGGCQMVNETFMCVKQLLTALSKNLGLSLCCLLQFTYLKMKRVCNFFRGVGTFSMTKLKI